MTEADWKIFKQIKERAIESYCRICLDEFKAAIDDESSSVQERYLLNYKLVQNRDKKMQLLFDGNSRSKAWLQLLAIRGEGLADEILVAKLSAEFQEQTNPLRSKW